MELTADRVESILMEVAHWATKRGNISAAVLVGSWARGTARADSDIDFVLLTPVSWPRDVVRQDGQALAEIALVDGDILATQRTVCAHLVTSLRADRVASPVFTMPAPSPSTT